MDVSVDIPPVIGGIMTSCFSNGKVTLMWVKLFVSLVGGSLLVLAIWAGVLALYSKFEERIDENLLRDLEELIELTEDEINE
ncbi:hypothetical protein [Thermococcus sp.]